jgi:hypothetical protein
MRPVDDPATLALRHERRLTFAYRVVAEAVVAAVGQLWPSPAGLPALRAGPAAHRPAGDPAALRAVEPHPEATVAA